MKRTRLLLVTALCLSLVTALFGLAACGGGGGGGVAATVNGTDILESTVTEQIETMRAQSEDYADDAGWAQALSSSGLTPESLRESTIENLAKNILVVQEAESQGITTDDEAIDAQIEQTKTTVGGDDETWLETLNAYGYKDEAAYREFVVTEDLKTQLYDGFEVEATDDELKEFIAQNPAAVEGWSLADGAATPASEEVPVEGTEGEEVPVEGTEGEGEEAAVDEAAAEETPVDEAAAEEVTYTAEDVDLSAIPEDILSQYKELWVTNNKGTKFNEWIEELYENADITINDMPEDVSYNVDMSLAETDTDTETDGSEEEPVQEEQTSLSSEVAVQEALAAGLEITDEVVGEGEIAADGDTVMVYYTGMLEDGTVFESNFDSGSTFDFTLGVGSVIRGWDAGVVGMQVGGTRILTIPASLAYGDTGNGSNVPAGATLTFTIELVDVVKA